MTSVFVLTCLVVCLCCLYSEASNCTTLKRCPWKNFCYCYDHSRIKAICENGQWQPQNCDCPPLKNPDVNYSQGNKIGNSYTLKTLAKYKTYTCICSKRGWRELRGWPTSNCDIPLKTVQPEKTCKKLPNVTFANVNYSKPILNGYAVGTKASYTCREDPKPHNRHCTKDGRWNGSEPICSCSAPAKSGPHQKIVYQPERPKNGRYQFGTKATYYCLTGTGEHFIGRSSCQTTGKWVGNPPSILNCLSKIQLNPTRIHDKTTTTNSVLHHKEERTLVIVSGTTGAILGALIILVVIVSCQRRLHYHRMRRARLRHRQDQDAFTAFITYHRDVRLMLPSYDEAINQREQGQPPTFEEALGHYEEPSLPPGETPASETPPSSVSNNTSASSASPVSCETQNSSESDSNTAPSRSSWDGQSVPPSGDSRFLRSLRVLFGGRPFRTDAIYCRFVPEDDGNESDRNTERNSSSSAAEDDLSEVLARAGLC